MPKKVQQTEHPVLDMTMPERKATDMSGFFRDHKLPAKNVTGFSDWSRCLRGTASNG